MFSKLLILTTTALVAVNAQGSSSASITTTGSAVPSGLPTGLTPCILACIQPAAIQNGCAAYTDVTCVCSSAQFQADAGACLQQHCSTPDMQAALALQSATCAAVSLSATGTSVAPKSVSFTLPSSGTASTTSAASVTTSAKGTTTAATVTTPNGSSTASSSSSASSPAASSAAAASLLVANSGVGAIVAMIAGFLAI